MLRDESMVLIVELVMVDTCGFAMFGIQILNGFAFGETCEFVFDFDLLEIGFGIDIEGRLFLDRCRWMLDSFSMEDYLIIEVVFGYTKAKLDD